MAIPAELYQDLNAEQARAVQTLDGPLLILAGAGSGKTRVLTRRIAALLARGTEGEGEHARWLNPWNILAVTFTNKAAGEMRERVAALVGDTAKDVWISTFHSTCTRILRRDIEPLGWKRDFAIYDDDDQLRVLKAVLQELKIPREQLVPTALRGRIDRYKNGIEAGTTYLRSDPFPKLLELYEARLKQQNALDFNDLVNKVVELWETQPETLARWQSRWRYVLVDEYQDTNPSQYRFLRLLACGDRPNLAVVGDDDQSIYRFRGADIQNILGFEEDFPGCAVIRLEQNYRSTGHILAAASSVVARNKGRKEKTLWTRSAEGEPVRLLLSDDTDAEAADVVSRIEQLGQPYSNYAVIYRTNASSRPFEQAFARARIPFILVGGRKFYQRMEVRDILAYLRLVANPVDNVAFERIINVPARALGDKAVEAIKAEASRAGVPLRQAARTLGQGKGRTASGLAAFSLLLDRFERALSLMPPGDFVLYVATESGYFAMLEKEDSDEANGRIENVKELARAAAADEDDDNPYGADPADAAGEKPGAAQRLRAFLDRATLTAQSDDLPGDDSGAVTLLTAHLAKGLEFPVVFVVGLVEKSFPHARAELEDDIEEERRLAYVAFTRARERLFLTAPMRRRAPEGWWDDTTLSRFVHEVPDSALVRPASSWGRTPAWSGRSLGASFGRGAPALPPFRSGGPAPRTATPTWAPRPASAPTVLAPAMRPVGLRTLQPDSMEGFDVGTEVLHPLLGLGTVKKREGTPSNPRLTIHFDKHGPRTVYAVSASLEIVVRP